MNSFYDCPELIKELFEKINHTTMEGLKRFLPEADIGCPVLRQGGYIPKIDHSASLYISLENYTFYVNTLKGTCGI